MAYTIDYRIAVRVSDPRAQLDAAHRKARAIPLRLRVLTVEQYNALKAEVQPSPPTDKA